MNTRTRLFYAVVFAIVVLGIPAIAGAAVLFSDNFNAGASAAWSNERGSWRDTGGQYDATSPDNSPLTYSSVTTHPALANFAVDVDVNEWDDGGVYLRSAFNAGAITGILLVTGGKSGSFGGFYWHCMVGGNPGGILQESADLGLQGTNHHLRIEVSGSTYRAYVDGILRDTLVDATYASGSVALYDFSPISGASAPRGQTFDNVVISSLEARISEPGALALLAVGLFTMCWMRARRQAVRGLSALAMITRRPQLTK